jgi:hypothetical protein
VLLHGIFGFGKGVGITHLYSKAPLCDQGEWDLSSCTHLGFFPELDFSV